MEPSRSIERFEVSLNTPAGECSTSIEIPSGKVLITALVPLLRVISEQAQALEEKKATEAGKTVSCKKGCAACCRMLVPVSAPEAFALRELIQTLPEPRRRVMLNNIAEVRTRLEQAGLLTRLTQVAETDQQLSDEEIEPINRDYYALRVPCPFLEEDLCTIHEHRPAACRELLVTSPAELCQEMTRNPVRPLPVPVRMSTVLGMLWSDLAGGPTRLIPLPLALEWADRHAAENRSSWEAKELLDNGLDKVSRYLSQEFASRKQVGPGGAGVENTET